jgi:hypothetical protein
MSGFSGLGIDDQPRRLDFQALIEYHVDSLISKKTARGASPFQPRTQPADVQRLLQYIEKPVDETMDATRPNSPAVDAADDLLHPAKDDYSEPNQDATVPTRVTRARATSADRRTKSAARTRTRVQSVYPDTDIVYPSDSDGSKTPPNR